MEQPYSKREMDIKFDSLIENINNNHTHTVETVQGLETKIDQVIVKVDKTNGSVRKHEKMLYGIIITGPVAIFLGGIIIGLVVYIYQYQLAQQSTRITNLKEQIQLLKN